MIKYLRQKKWSPYVVGFLIGILSWLTFVTADHPIGVTTAFENTAAVSLKSLGPTIASENSFFSKPGTDPKIDWEWFFVIGIFIGALISSRLSKDQAKESVPPLWLQRFGPSISRRYIAAFFGGAIMMIGARFAQGCTSGHMISGTLQLAVSSWVFAAVVFTFGILFSRSIYGKKLIEDFYGKPI